jgi:hypothetical protein
MMVSVTDDPKLSSARRRYFYREAHSGAVVIPQKRDKEIFPDDARRQRR